MVVDLVSFGSSELTTSLDEPALPEFVIFPNPATTQLTISVTDDFIESVQLFDTSGKMLKSQDTGQNARVTLNIEDVVPGLYFVRLQFESGSVNTKVIVD